MHNVRNQRWTGDLTDPSRSGDGRWTEAIVELSRIVVGSDSLDAIVGRVAELAKQSLPGAIDVSVTVVEDNGKPRTVIFTGPLAVDLDERQYRAGFGPCLDAAATGQTLVLDTDDASSAYPEFGELALRAGVRQVVSVGLPLGQQTVGGMNIYGTDELTSDAAFVERAEAFAGYAAVAVNNAAAYARVADLSGQMQAAMESRAVIEQAKGIIMARERCTPEDAFDILRRVSPDPEQEAPHRRPVHRRRRPEMTPSAPGLAVPPERSGTCIR